MQQLYVCMYVAVWYNIISFYTLHGTTLTFFKVPIIFLFFLCISYHENIYGNFSNEV